MTTPTTEAIASPRPRRSAAAPSASSGPAIGEMLGRRRLTRYLVGAELKRTHADTAFGQIWWILDPLLQMAVYYRPGRGHLQAPDPGLSAVPVRGDPALEVVHARRSTRRRCRSPVARASSARSSSRRSSCRRRRVIAGTVSFGFGLDRARHRLPVLPRPAQPVGPLPAAHRRRPVRVHAGARASCSRRSTRSSATSRTS